MSDTAPVVPPGIFPPPPGVTANFVNPPQHTNGLVPLIGVFLTLSTIFLALRLYTKAFLLRILGWEDVAIVVAWMADIVFMAFYIRGIQLNASSHIWNFTMATFPEYARLAVAANLLYVITTGLPRISVLIFYLRLNPSRNFRICTFIVLGLTFAYTIGLFLVQLFACHPVEKLWKPLMPGTCIDQRPIFLTLPIVGTILDILTLTLPIPMLITLHVNIRTKILLMALFSVCSCTVILSALRIWSTAKLLDTADLNWNAATTNCFTVAEVNLMIVCGSVLVLRPFCRRHLPFLLGGVDGNSRSSNDILGFGGKPNVNKDHQDHTPNYDGPMGPRSKNEYRAKVRANGGHAGRYRTGPKRGLWGIDFKSSIFTTTDDDDDDLEGLSAELRRLPAVGMKRNTYDHLDDPVNQANEPRAVAAPTTSTHHWPTSDIDNNHHPAQPHAGGDGNSGGGGGHAEPRAESREAFASGDAEPENGIVKTVSLDVR